MVKVGILVGSLREASYTKFLAEGIAKALPADWEATFLQIGDLPLYNEDLETDNAPAEWTRFREEAKAQDAFIFATPEYNRAAPATLYNAIDVGSRPWGESVWGGKPALVASQSQAGIGGALANHSVRQKLVFVDVNVMAQPEVYVGNTPEIFDEQGNIKVDDTKEFLQSVVDAFVDYANKFI